MLAGSCRSAEPPQVEPSTPSRRVATRAEVPPDRPLRAGFLVVDGVYNSELVAPYDILHHTQFHTTPRPGIEVFTVSPDGERVTTFEGLTLVPHYGFGDHPTIDILVVPSAEHSMDTDLQDAELIAWVRSTGEAAQYVVSLCDGAFVLAQAGLLDRRVSTTFPSDIGRMRAMYPTLEALRVTV